MSQSVAALRDFDPANDRLGETRSFGDMGSMSGLPETRTRLADFMSTRPSVMGPVMSSLPSDRHVAELTLLSVVGAEAATLCC
jgi:hypothetical protein